MLSCLRVRNFAIIDELEVELGPGMNVVTGETGAGKSILVDALELVLGARARPDVVRAGEAQAEVEALFDEVGAGMVAKLAELGVDADTDGELLVRRVVTAQGRSRAYVNGTLVTATQLQALASGLLDISSQHEHHALGDAAAQLASLDAFGGHGRELARMRAAHDELAAAEHALAEARDGERTRSEREDLLRFQLSELDELEPRPAELAELVTERDRLRHAEKLLGATTAAEDALYGRDGSISEELSQIAARLEASAALDPALAPLAESVRGASAQLSDVAHDLGAYTRGLGRDPERLETVEERAHAIARLAKKHGLAGESDPAGALAQKRDAARTELEALGRGEARIAELEAHRARAHDAAAAVAATLSAARAKAATALGRALERELRGLGMASARVSFGLEPRRGPGGELRLGPTGGDVVALLVSTNEGEEARPLGAIASGGELSRTMLAFKRVLSERGPDATSTSGSPLRLDAGDLGQGARPLFVFDEVDVGVSGAIGEVLGRSIADVAKHHAVLCITHLAPIAAYADRHFVVRKSVDEGRTRSSIVELKERERVDELARMLGGLHVTKKTRGVALELLRGAREAGLARAS